MVENNPEVGSLSLRNVSLGDKGIKHLSSVLKNSANVKVHRLEYSLLLFIIVTAFVAVILTFVPFWGERCFVFIIVVIFCRSWAKIAAEYYSFRFTLIPQTCLVLVTAMPKNYYLYY